MTTKSDECANGGDEIGVTSPWLSAKIRGKTIVLRDVILLMVALGVGAGIVTSSLALGLTYLHREDVKEHDGKFVEAINSASNAQIMAINERSAAQMQRVDAALHQMNSILAQMAETAKANSRYQCEMSCIISKNMAERSPVSRQECRDQCAVR